MLILTWLACYSFNNFPFWKCLLLQVLESKLTAQEKNRAEQLQKSKEKMAEQLAKVERAQKELEIQTEAARLSAECALNAKLTKV